MKVTISFKYLGKVYVKEIEMPVIPQKGDEIVFDDKDLPDYGTVKSISWVQEGLEWIPMLRMKNNYVPSDFSNRQRKRESELFIQIFSENASCFSAPSPTQPENAADKIHQ